MRNCQQRICCIVWSWRYRNCGIMAMIIITPQLHSWAGPTW